MDKEKLNDSLVESLVNNSLEKSAPEFFKIMVESQSEAGHTFSERQITLIKAVFEYGYSKGFVDGYLQGTLNADKS